MNELKIAINQTKRSLRSLNYPLLVIGSFIISILGTLMIIAYHPENLSQPFMIILWFIIRGGLGMMALMVSCLIVAIFVDTYRPRILKNYNNNKNYLLSVLGILKHAQTIVKEHTDSNEYKNMLFENMLKNEKPTIWNWFGRIFVHTQKHIIDQEEINKKVQERLEKLERLFKKVLKKKDDEISYWKNQTFKVRKKLSEYQKESNIDEKNGLEDDQPL